MLSKLTWLRIYPAIACFVIFLSVFFECRGDDFNINNRPKIRENNRLYDYAVILQDMRESSDRYLETIEKSFGIETLIVTVPSLEGETSIEQLAVKIFNNWEIGRNYGGKGILVVLADDCKQVKLEVSYELEDVFTDAFCGYIEDLQLRPYFLAGQLGTGLIAVMEEIEKRSQIKYAGSYDSDYIQKLDKELLLSGGAGAKRDLLKFENEEVKKDADNYPAGQTPQESWQTLIRSWQDKTRDYNLGIYTEITKLTYRDYQNLPDSRYEKDVRTYADKPFEVIQNNSYAVIFFGNKTGWDNSPYLLCKTPEGWKFDIVHQRKYIRMGASPYWGIERADHPYMELLSRCPFWMGQDIPLPKEDIYRVKDDKKIAERILQLENLYSANPDDFNTVMELGRLYTITSMGMKTIPLLKKAQQLDSQSPLPYKYLAIINVDTNYQYETAVEELKEYVKREPADVFGHNFLGYLYCCLEQYEPAVSEFKKAVEIEPDNGYAYCKLSRCYSQLYLKSSALDLRRNLYKQTAIEMFEKAGSVPNPDYRRIGWLKSWLKNEKII